MRKIYLIGIAVFALSFSAPANAEIVLKKGKWSNTFTTTSTGLQGVAPPSPRVHTIVSCITESTAKVPNTKVPGCPDKELKQSGNNYELKGECKGMATTSKFTYISDIATKMDSDSVFTTPKGTLKTHVTIDSKYVGPTCDK